MIVHVLTEQEIIPDTPADLDIRTNEIRGLFTSRVRAQAAAQKIAEAIEQARLSESDDDPEWIREQIANINFTITPTTIDPDAIYLSEIGRVPLYQPKGDQDG